jgi:hypothetical protein
MTADDPDAPLPAQASPAEGQLTVSLQPRTVQVHYLTRAELHALAAPNVSIHLTFFGVSAGAALRS